jgi:hypothetical protein
MDTKLLSHIDDLIKRSEAIEKEAIALTKKLKELQQHSDEIIKGSNKPQKTELPPYSPDEGKHSDEQI